VPVRIVHRVTVCVQDYFEVVEHPMDLSTIREKLNLGKYADPWECINDIQLMFDNAWLYNRKTSKVYKYCSKVMLYVCICKQFADGVNSSYCTRPRTFDTSRI